MVNETVARFIDYMLLELEGGAKLWDDPDGGLTKYGFASFFHLDLDIVDLTLEMARIETIERYYKKYRFNQLPHGYDMLCLDWGFNAGPGFIGLLQRFVGTHPDGIIGPKTCLAFLKFTESSGGPHHGLARINTQRIIEYEGKRNYNIYREGWLNRINKAITWIASEI